MEAIRAEEISQIISKQIKEYEKKLDISETGTVLSVGDGIARIYGVQNAMSMELLEFPGNILGMVLNLERDNVGVAILGEDTMIKEGDIVKRTGRIATRAAANANRATPKQKVPRRSRSEVIRAVMPTKNRTVASSTVLVR